MGKDEKKTKAEEDKEAPASVEKKVKKEAPPLAPVPKRIRILVSLATFERAYEPGHTYEVGKDLSEKSARNYLKNGLAEEDTSLPGAPETK